MPPVPSKRSVRVWLLAALLLLVLSVDAAETFGAKIEPGTRECISEMIEAGGTLGFNFRVTDGGAFDIDVEINTTFTPPVEKMEDVSRWQFNNFFAARRDMVVSKRLNSWYRVSEGSHSYLAPSVTTTKHGLPEEITVCFDNTFSTVSPKWVSFTFLKRDVLEVDADALDRVEAAMERRLHDIGTFMFNLTMDMNQIGLEGNADRARADAVSKGIVLGLVFDAGIMVVMIVYQYYFITRFLSRMRPTDNIKVAAK
ncbi:transmembrane emp24 domain-containing protein 2 [Angomonas deanei]|uniref:Emp24/gp25L/p24 family/GOLD, putative n=1 Tax=Angomonas deanei TaxID=59799 RepID=S9V956_9TRYP|nr:transmembrane emp24 domain trafficking protein 2 [Angomonas deanei]EPY42030.1 transmembrane emp24 domain trafficking protein 2 [Angomonas deanei]EPY43560.1 transmembrane emp24 domain-containing protein 2 [Angomonas deanei]CAD2213506.1 emp24/gp25L/p24 family/GOLD, putative [Angomonas deanei]|eukprot:EPY39562.1 transmembrane emp24 domain trafficking protein 2 [Angomonas deanei]